MCQRGGEEKEGKEKNIEMMILMMSERGQERKKGGGDVREIFSSLAAIESSRAQLDSDSTKFLDLRSLPCRRRLICYSACTLLDGTHRTFFCLLVLMRVTCMSTGGDPFAQVKMRQKMEACAVKVRNNIEVHEVPSY